MFQACPDSKRSLQIRKRAPCKLCRPFTRLRLYSYATHISIFVIAILPSLVSYLSSFESGACCNANWWGAKYRVSEQRDEHGRSGDFREWKFIIERLIYKRFCWTRAGFTALHGLVPISTLVPQMYIAFAPRTKGRLCVPPCGRWLVKMVSSDFSPWAGTLKKPQLRDAMTWPRACLE